MVAKIKSGKSLTGALHYNEQKVKQGKAELIGAMGYFKDAASLSFFEKLLRLTDLATRNERTRTNAVHVSLNFANGETLPIEKLNAIAGKYMTGIGFENQPYLIYRHMDAGHPHIHIVTTNIKRDGERISLHYLGQNESEITRKAIETEFGLIRAEDQQQQRPDLITNISAAEYGQVETKRVITNVLNAVIRTYKFTSVAELNAVLGQYNVQADRGSKDSRMYARSGLVYWVLDKKGSKIGVPIKASSVYGEPTLKTLEAKFRLNEQLRKPLKAGLIQTIDGILAKPKTENRFLQALAEKSIQCILRRNPEGRIYGVTFIDQKNKAVFNGSDLGRPYSANLLSAKFQPELTTQLIKEEQSKFVASGQVSSPVDNNTDLLDILFTPERDAPVALHRLKRKKRKGLNL